MCESMQLEFRRVLDRSQCHIHISVYSCGMHFWSYTYIFFRTCKDRYNQFAFHNQSHSQQLREKNPVGVNTGGGIALNFQRSVGKLQKFEYHGTTCPNPKKLGENIILSKKKITTYLCRNIYPTVKDYRSTVPVELWLNMCFTLELIFFQQNGAAREMLFPSPNLYN